MLYSVVAITTGIDETTRRPVSPFVSAALFADNPTEAVVTFLSRVYFSDPSNAVEKHCKEKTLPSELLAIRVTFPQKKRSLIAKASDVAKFDPSFGSASPLGKKVQQSKPLNEHDYEDLCVLFDRSELERLIPKIQEAVTETKSFFATVFVQHPHFSAMPIRAFDPTEAAKLVFSSFVQQNPNAIVHSVLVAERDTLNKDSKTFALEEMARLFKEDIEASEEAEKASSWM